MPVLMQLSRKLSSSSRAATTGWVGIDVGSRTIKLAQLERRKGHWVLERRWQLQEVAEPFRTQAAVAAGELERHRAEFRRARQMFRGRQAAAALSINMTELRQYEIPVGSRGEMRDMLRQELSADGEKSLEECTFDFWEGEGETPEFRRTTAVAMPEQAAQRLACDLDRAGYACRVLDALPCALARAATLAQEDPAQPVAVLDLGEQAPTLVVAAGGRPEFTRVLRCGGLHALLQPLREALQLSHAEASQLLLRYGIPDIASGPLPAGGFPTQLLAQPLTRLMDELQRTLEYVAQQPRLQRPERLWLVGGGAAVQRLPQYIENQIQLPVDRWHLPGHQDVPMADFAVASALSALAWEDR